MAPQRGPQASPSGVSVSVADTTHCDLADWASLSSHSVTYVSLKHRFWEREIAPDSLIASGAIELKLGRRQPVQ